MQISTQHAAKARDNLSLSGTTLARTFNHQHFQSLLVRLCVFALAQARTAPQGIRDQLKCLMPLTFNAALISPTIQAPINKTDTRICHHSSHASQVSGIPPDRTATNSARIRETRKTLLFIFYTLQDPRTKTASVWRNQTLTDRTPHNGMDCVNNCPWRSTQGTVQSRQTGRFRKKRQRDMSMAHRRSTLGQGEAKSTIQHVQKTLVIVQKNRLRLKIGSHAMALSETSITIGHVIACGRLTRPNHRHRRPERPEATSNIAYQMPFQLLLRTR